MKKILASRWAYVLAFIAGGLLVLAFAPTNQFYFAAIASAIFYLLIQKVTAKRAAMLGWCFGLGQFGFGVSWVYISIHVFGNTPMILAGFLTALFVAVLALFHALQAYLLVRYFPQNTHKKLFLVFPLSWALIEWLRSWLFTGFPWLLMGYSQVHSPLKGYIPILGEYGITFILCFTAALLVFALQRWRCSIRWSLSLLCILTIWGIGGSLAEHSWTKSIGKPVSVAMVQGNIAQSIKWNPESFINTLRVYAQASQANWNSKIIIWPEAAVPIPQKYAKDFLGKISAEAKQHNVSLFTGIPVNVPNSFSYYNGMIALGEGSGHYYKRHLVPFGEYVPFAKLLRGLMGFLSLPMSDMLSGPANQPDLKAQNIILAPFICYEIAYDNQLLQLAPRANVLVTISDDAWFGNSLAPFQHLEIGQFRAIQSGRDMLFASNDGVTALVNEYGNVYKQIPQFKRLVLSGEFQPKVGMTPWLYYGNRPIILIMLLSLLFLAIWERRNK